MSYEQALAEAEAFIRRSAERIGNKPTDKAIKEAAKRVVEALPPVAMEHA